MTTQMSKHHRLDNGPVGTPRVRQLKLWPPNAGQVGLNLLFLLTVSPNWPVVNQNGQSFLSAGQRHSSQFCTGQAGLNGIFCWPLGQTDHCPVQTDLFTFPRSLVAGSKISNGFYESGKGWLSPRHLELCSHSQIKRYSSRLPHLWAFVERNFYLRKFSSTY